MDAFKFLVSKSNQMHRRVKNFLKKRLYRRTKKLLLKAQSKRAEKIAKNVESELDPLVFLNNYLEKKFSDKILAWKAVLLLYEWRSPAFDIISAQYWRINDEEMLMLILLQKELLSVSDAKAKDLEKYNNFMRSEREIKNISEYKRILCAIIIKKIELKYVLGLIDEFNLQQAVGPNNVLKMIKRASKENNIKIFMEIKKKYDWCLEGVGKVKVSYWEAKLLKNYNGSFEAIRDEFYKIDKRLVREFKQYLDPLFCKITIENNLIDCYIDKKKFTKIKKIIEYSIISHKSFSFVRLNDGEGYGFNNALPCEFDVERQELHWWGEVLAEQLRYKIREKFRLSLHHHDLVGIPSVLRFIDELSISRDDSVSNNALLCRLFTLCHGYLKVYDGRAYITEGQINLYLFDREYINKLAKLANHVVFVSGAKKEYLQSVFEDLNHATYIELPTHRLLKAEKFSYSDATKPLPYVYEDYLEKIKKLAGSGVVFFISAGFIGKIFAAEVAKSGGVALDVGQTLMNIVANHIDD